jgi:hypothetical protein
LQICTDVYYHSSADGVLFFGEICLWNTPGLWLGLVNTVRNVFVYFVTWFMVHCMVYCKQKHSEITLFSRHRTVSSRQLMKLRYPIDKSIPNSVCQTAPQRSVPIAIL